MTPSSSHPEDKGSMDLWKVGTLPHYTASQHRRPRHETSPPWKPRNWYDLTEGMKVTVLHCSSLGERGRRRRRTYI